MPALPGLSEASPFEREIGTRGQRLLDSSHAHFDDWR